MLSGLNVLIRGRPGGPQLRRPIDPQRYMWSTVSFAIMARYQVEEKASTVSIEVSDVSGKEHQLMQAFGECQSGHCSCPTDEYAKLASMRVEQSGDSIRIQLEPRPGERLDVAEIAACLDYTTDKVAKPDQA